MGDNTHTVQLFVQCRRHLAKSLTCHYSWVSGSTGDLHQGHFFPKVKDSGLWLDLNGPHPLDVGLTLARHRVLQVNTCEPRACGFVCWFWWGELVPVSLIGRGTQGGDVPTGETKLTALIPAPDIQVPQLWNQLIPIIHSQWRNFNYCRFINFLPSCIKLQDYKIASAKLLL